MRRETVHRPSLVFGDGRAIKAPAPAQTRPGPSPKSSNGRVFAVLRSDVVVLSYPEI